MYSKGMREMFFNPLSSILTGVLSFVTRVPDRLLEMAWKTVMYVAPVHSNVTIDVTSLFTWNVIPYRSPKVPVSRWAEFLKASHEYQEAVKEEIWMDVKDNVLEVKRFSIKYIEGKAGLRSLYPYACVLLRALKSVFQLFKAKECHEVSIRALQDVKEEMEKEQQKERESWEELASQMSK